MAKPASDKIIWLLLFVSVTLPAIVHHNKKPFARTLIRCDVPVNATTGSKWCGDRLEVIDAGNKLASLGATIESVCTAPMVILSGFFADRWGRKTVMLMSTTGVTISIALLYFATTLLALAWPLFILANAVLGLSCIGFIIELIPSDLALRPGADSTAIFAVKAIVQALGEGMGLMIGSQIQALELTDYTSVWMKVLLVCALFMPLVMFFLPETQAVSTRGSERSGLASEFAGYKQIWYEFPMFKYMLLDAFLNGQIFALPVQIPTILLGHHDFTQKASVIATFPLVCLAPISTPWLGLIQKKFGHRRGWEMFYWCRLIAMSILLYLASTHYAITLLSLLASMCFIGFFPVWHACRLRLLGEKFNAKGTGLCQIAGIAGVAGSNFIMGAMFSAKANTYTEKSLPLRCCVACMWMSRLVYELTYKDAYHQIF
eukprot:CAMPEP_0180705446 /NCGR_PEP_ID=MMETSP1038_2-20121128/7683_1 /TAXON_ID=632150 /ORGANISM="Azadinium spinosum, Strain 3D9" /LENGTH=430 /DNA_ID=CAMNT_0022737325 /DNA_START=55 /DNA_END=1344 /DNA_ORIENTATION=-